MQNHAMRQNTIQAAGSGVVRLSGSVLAAVTTLSKKHITKRSKRGKGLLNGS